MPATCYLPCKTYFKLMFLIRKSDSWTHDQKVSFLNSPFVNWLFYSEQTYSVGFFYLIHYENDGFLHIRSIFLNYQICELPKPDWNTQQKPTYTTDLCSDLELCFHSPYKIGRLLTCFVKKWVNTMSINEITKWNSPFEILRRVTLNKSKHFFLINA